MTGLRFEDLAAQATFADYLAAVHQALQRRSALDRAIEQAWPQSPFAESIARLRCFRGIDTLSAAGIASDVGDFHRFAHPRRLAGFLGIVPSEYSSGDRRRQGSITKAGPLTPDDSSSKPPTTTATGPPSASDFSAASTASIRA